MIRPLRRRHRQIVALAALLLALAAWVAHTHPIPPRRVDHLPIALRSGR